MRTAALTGCCVDGKFVFGVVFWSSHFAGEVQVVGGSRVAESRPELVTKSSGWGLDSAPHELEMISECILSPAYPSTREEVENR